MVVYGAKLQARAEFSVSEEKNLIFFLTFEKKTHLSQASHTSVKPDFIRFWPTRFFDISSGCQNVKKINFSMLINLLSTNFKNGLELILYGFLTKKIESSKLLRLFVKFEKFGKKSQYCEYLQKT